MTANGLFVAFNFNAFAVVRILIPVQEDAAEAGDQFVGDVARFTFRMAFTFRMNAAQHGYAGTHHVHRMGMCRQAFQNFDHTDRQTAHRFEFGFISSQLEFIGQMAVNQQVGDFFKLAFLCQIQNVVTAIAQIVAGTANGTQFGITGRNARKRNGFFRFESRGLSSFSHGISPLYFYGFYFSDGRCGFVERPSESGYLFLKQFIQFLLEGMIIQMLVQLGTGLHSVNHCGLSAITHNRFINIQSGFACCAER